MCKEFPQAKGIEWGLLISQFHTLINLIFLTLQFHSTSGERILHDATIDSVQRERPMAIFENTTVYDDGSCSNTSPLYIDVIVSLL